MAVPANYVAYAGSSGDFVGSGSTGEPLIIAGGQPVTVYNDGVQLTDIYDASGTGPLTEILTDSFGTYSFYAAPNLGTLEVSADGGVSLYPTQPSYVGDVVEGISQTLQGITPSSGIPLSQKGQPDGVATLNSSGLLVQQVPSTTRVVGLDEALTLRVLTTDVRLSDARTPKAHAASHIEDGTDPIGITMGQVAQLLETLADKAPVRERYWDPVARVWTPRPTTPPNTPVVAYSTYDPTANPPPGGVLGDEWHYHPDQA